MPVDISRRVTLASGPDAIELHDDGRFVISTLDAESGSRLETVLEGSAKDATVGGRATVLTVRLGDRTERLDFQAPVRRADRAAPAAKRADLGPMSAPVQRGTVGSRRGSYNQFVAFQGSARNSAHTIINSGIGDWIGMFKLRGARMRYLSQGTILVAALIVIALVIAVITISYFAMLPPPH
ncbi:MAG TPA: hypothetical protein VHU90_06805 [Galbitalea sp.]|nr:hypothetical protein [Galbitalea sp.]